ncbi:hypothetical protein HH310_01220 [Actinoplanes sp. TBRC 11911]|uniref:hypothetical protein n=1 Tax=Actinoplanes sp. TBRC 11911 TaxID=2729386 RepID=UPI00145DB5B9|nr:hypothetical protein [Actinoplanes sp. TBRC 11911]NMO49821.1 hypothetical protein [Actinoplanes sp. TBRC 11911]
MKGLPRTTVGWSMVVFGVIAVVLGVVGVVRPEALLALLGFEVVPAHARASGDYTRVFLTASSMASLNMGVYYLVAAATEWRPFFRFTVGFRLLTFTVFTTLVLLGDAPARFFGVALWEGVGAAATGLALLHDRRTAASLARG